MAVVAGMKKRMTTQNHKKSNAKKTVCDIDIVNPIKTKCHHSSGCLEIFHVLRETISLSHTMSRYIYTMSLNQIGITKQEYLVLRLTYYRIFLTQQLTLPLSISIYFSMYCPLSTPSSLPWLSISPLMGRAHMGRGDTGREGHGKKGK